MICLHLDGFKDSKWVSSSFWPVYGTLPRTTYQDQSGLGSNGNEGVSK